MQKNGKTEDGKPIRPKEAQPGVRMVRRQYFQLLPYQVLMIVVNAVNGMWTGLLQATASARRP